MKKMLFVPAVVFFFTVLAIYLNQEKDIRVKFNQGDNSYMDEVSIVQKKDGTIGWTLGAKKAVFINDNNVKLTDLTIVFPEKNLVLTSDGGMYDMKERNLKIDGNIKASTKDYDIIATTLFFDSRKNEIFSDNKVRIVGKKYYIEGDSLVATGDKATLSRNVRAVFDAK